MSKADLSKQPAQVAAMFDDVSTHYDRTNAVLSMGNAALWRVATTRAVGPRAGEIILDVAAGTGTSSASLARNGASVVAADFSAGMIEVGRHRQQDNPFVSFVHADATELPFDDASFDAVTISFGLRNIVDPHRALAEFHRVTKPGGRVVICEFSRPPTAPIRAGYTAYLRYGMPVLAKLASSNPAAYDYLMESIQAWPSQPALAEWLREAGYERVAWRNLTAGIVALHRGWKPAGASVSAADTAGAVKSGARNSAATEPGPTASARSAKPGASAKAGTTAKPVSAESAETRSTPARPATAKSEPVKPVPVKPPSAKSATAKSTSAKSATAKPASAKSATAKPAPAKPTPAKPPARPRGESSSTVPPEGE